MPLLRQAQTQGNKELGARYVLEGSVQKAGDALRVTAQLLDAKDGTHLWAETYDRELSAASIFAVQDEITEQVVAMIGGSYGVISLARQAEIKKKPTDSLDAYEVVLQVSAYYSSSFSPSEHARLREALERAVKLDPSYAGAWSSLSLIYLDEDRYNFNPRPDPLDRALEAARKAVAADPTSQRAHSALATAYFHLQELDAFSAEAESAVSLNPNSPITLASLGLRLHLAGDRRGIAWVRKAMKLDPFLPTHFHFVIADHHFERAEYEAALVAARRINLPGFSWTQIFLAAIYAELGRQSEARAAVEGLLRLSPGFTTETWMELMRKWNYHGDARSRWAAALRKAGLPE